MTTPWVGVDLDRTLAEYHGWDGGKIGRPIQRMVERVHALRKGGYDVRIFTARVAVEDPEEKARIVADIQAWCEEHLGYSLPVTNTKDMHMVGVYDDLAYPVEENTGRTLDSSLLAIIYESLETLETLLKRVEEDDNATR